MLVALIGLLMIVADDAEMLAGDDVNGPFSAYAEAQVIEKHSLDATGGETYAELDREDPLRETAMSASFLRASLFTSVVAFGVAAMAMGLGLTLILIALALMSVARAAEREVIAAERTVRRVRDGVTEVIAVRLGSFQSRGHHGGEGQRRPSPRPA